MSKAQRKNQHFHTKATTQNQREKCDQARSQWNNRKRTIVHKFPCRNENSAGQILRYQPLETESQFFQLIFIFLFVYWFKQFGVLSRQMSSKRRVSPPAGGLETSRGEVFRESGANNAHFQCWTSCKPHSPHTFQRAKKQSYRSTYNERLLSGYNLADLCF